MKVCLHGDPRDLFLSIERDATVTGERGDRPIHGSRVKEFEAEARRDFTRDR